VRAALDGTARLLGTRPPEEMPAAFAVADFFCLPSWWEAMPMSVLEAMAASLPVVATDVGDVARLVEDGVTGYVVAPHAPEELAAALRKLLTDPRSSRAMGAAGRARVEERFSAAATARGVCEVYDEASGRRS
jgi:glycosyltransferase involved in cell wall biosynthesis